MAYKPSIPTLSTSTWLLLCALLLMQVQPAFGWSSSKWNSKEATKTALFQSASNTKADDIASYVQGVTLKIAIDQNWGVADTSATESIRFTCGDSLDMVHRLRRDCQAVLVGRTTVEYDDCSLTIRRCPLPQIKEQPYRIILDTNRSLDMSQFRIFQDGFKTIVYHSCGESVDQADTDHLASTYQVTQSDDFPDVQMVGLPAQSSGPPYPSPELVLQHLTEHFGITSVMVEGGPKTAISFLKAGLVDRVILVQVPFAFEYSSETGLSREVFREGGLELLGTTPLGVDTVECWSRPGLQWPTTDISNWP